MEDRVMIDWFSRYALLIAAAGLVGCGERDGRGGSDVQEPEGATKRSPRAERVAEVRGTRQRLQDELEAAIAMPTGEERVHALSKLFQDSLEPAPDLAEKALREIPVDAEIRSELVMEFIRFLVNESKTREAMGWAESLNTQDQRRHARAQIAALLMETNEQEAMQLLSAEDLGADGVASTSGAVLQMWTSKEPEKAVTWASRLPNGYAREEGFQAVFSSWAGIDGADALSWIGKETNPHVREDALTGAARAFQNHPEPIMEAIFGDADPEIRAELERKIADLNAAEAVPVEPKDEE